MFYNTSNVQIKVSKLEIYTQYTNNSYFMKLAFSFYSIYVWCVYQSLWVIVTRHVWSFHGKMGHKLMQFRPHMFSLLKESCHKWQKPSPKILFDNRSQNTLRRHRKLSHLALVLATCDWITRDMWRQCKNSPEESCWSPCCSSCYRTNRKAKHFFINILSSQLKGLGCHSQN